MKNPLKFILILTALVLVLIGYGASIPENGNSDTRELVSDRLEDQHSPKWLSVQDTICIKDYFNYIDSLTDYLLSEHL